jgi:hypothetical protein
MIKKISKYPPQIERGGREREMHAYMHTPLSIDMLESIKL